MNKTALRNFATSARQELLHKVEERALKLGITPGKVGKPEVIHSCERRLSHVEKMQRIQLLNRMQEVGFDSVIEEVAYTWFNRLIALRFMEVNNYLPTGVRVLSSSEGTMTEPDMMKEAGMLSLDLDEAYVHKLKKEKKTDELFKYLIIQHCNDLNRYMPFMFEKIDDESEILFPDGLLEAGAFVQNMTNLDVLAEDNWKHVEVIGWLYQYYISAEKAKIFKKKKKYEVADIPFVTQLFTPDWIVQYMVENSLGRLWIEAHPDQQDLQGNWAYFLSAVGSEVDHKVSENRVRPLEVETIKCFDPAMGSGHILVYMFDVLYQLYKKSGYARQDIPKKIIENNLYGLDIDERAYQLASFAVVMKALSYDSGFLEKIERHGLSLNLTAIQETNAFTDAHIAYIADEEEGEQFDEVKRFIEQFQHARTLGSLIRVTGQVPVGIQERMKALQNKSATNLFSVEKREEIMTSLPKLVKQTEIMAQQYDVLVTNPPYVGANKMNRVLADFLNEHYPDAKHDLFAAFMELDHYLKEHGFYASITQHSWMFLSSFKKLRKKVIRDKFIENMLHLGPRAFEDIGGEVVQSTAFVWRNVKASNRMGTYLRLVDAKTPKEKSTYALASVQNPKNIDRYSFLQSNFEKIPGSPIAYWVPDVLLNMFETNKTLADHAVPRLGMATANNEAFLRLWFEVPFDSIHFRAKNREDAMLSGRRWFPYNKGGEYRKWYGNHAYVVDWENDGHRIRNFTNSRGKVRSHNYNLEYILKPSITWSALSSGSFSCRYSPGGFLFDNSGSSLFTDEGGMLFYIQGLLSTKIAQNLFQAINPTLNYQPGTVGMLPMRVPTKNDAEKEVLELVERNISLAQSDWDEGETSWDFETHPFFKYQTGERTICSSFHRWKTVAQKRFDELRRNEEALNRIFIRLYGLQEVVPPMVAAEEMTVRQAEVERDVKSFISYVVGCAFGRYSLDEKGLVYAGGAFDSTRYYTCKPVEGNILSVSPTPDLKKDIVSTFVDVVQMIFGEETLSANLEFVAEALGRRRHETAQETIRRYFMNDFFKDHIRMYSKRPIYWQFTSGKEKAFNCLIYIHRYDTTLISRIRADYLHVYMRRRQADKKTCLKILECAETSKEINEAKKELQSLERQIEELEAYDKLLSDLAAQPIKLDMNDGVKLNYGKFKDALVRK